MLNEKHLVNILKNNNESVIGFTNENLTDILIADNAFMLIINIGLLNPNGSLMRLVNKAKSSVLSSQNVFDMPTWSVKTKKFYKRKVTDYLNLFANMENLESEKAALLPFSVKILEETPISEEALFINDNKEYIAFNADYFNIFKNRNTIRNGVLLPKLYIEYASNKTKKRYSFLINNQDYKFLVMGLDDVNPTVLQFLATKK